MQKFTKARMLKYLHEKDHSLNILPIYTLKSSDFVQKRSLVIEQILSFAAGNPLIVRSSSSREDNEDFSNAGGFESVLNVQPTEDDIANAIERVYASYHANEPEEILIQPMLTGIQEAGVIFTADMDTFADYDIINYTEGNDSAAVTGGKGKSLKTFVHYKKSDIAITDNNIKDLLAECRKIEQILGIDALDIEFAITVQQIVYILQVRPIARGNKEILQKLNLEPVLNRIYRKVEKLSRRHPFLLGDTTCFGVMPDWNPAEILGVRPKKLAISLYKELITDSVWAHQRNNYGYRDLTMHPLMVSFCGVPYIDTRITFNSFIPKKLNENIAEKLVNYYLKRLQTYPKYHDKIEFEIVFSCYYLGIGNGLKVLLNYGFNENEIKRIEFSLLELTNNIIDPQEGLYKKDIEQIHILEEDYERIVHSDISLVDKIYWLIEVCKKYGTLTFAGVARAGFIAVQFLRSFVISGIITSSEYDAYMNSLHTVNKQLSVDLQSYYDGKMSKEEFLQEYGHIRPGTYDILSKRYDENFDYYFGKHRTIGVKNTDYRFSAEVLEKIQMELEQNGLLVSAQELLQFMKEAIEGREYLKFVFTKSVSKILTLIEELGVRSGISRNDMAYLDISVVKQLYSDLYCGDIGTAFKENINNNKKQHDYALQLKLPAIIVKPENVYQFYLLDEEPNYITQKSIYGAVVSLDEGNGSVDLRNKIVFIQSADPGYDYLFSQDIGGLVTQFGGANSHMAIRCAELGIPAVIGAGEQNYKKWKSHDYLTLDCLKKQVIPIEL